MVAQETLEKWLSSDEMMDVLRDILGISAHKYSNSIHSPLIDIYFAGKLRVLLYVSSGSLTDEDVGRMLRYSALRNPSVVLFVAKMVPTDIQKTVHYLNTLNLKQSDKEKHGIVFLSAVFLNRDGKLSIHFPEKPQIQL